MQIIKIIKLLCITKNWQLQLLFVLNFYISPNDCHNQYNWNQQVVVANNNDSIYNTKKKIKNCSRNYFLSLQSKLKIIIIIIIINKDRNKNYQNLNSGNLRINGLNSWLFVVGSKGPSSVMEALYVRHRTLTRTKL